VAAQALRAGVVDRLVLFLAPALLGGDAVPAVGALGVTRVREAVRLGDVAVGRIGRDLVVEARVRAPFASRKAAR
jgi:diaminohydroxyphosphoribosylaminopyrimidine deaminase/5-amino-6-(5-phosphoribosylamino)uracil reductase